MNIEELLNSDTGQQLVKTYHAEQQQKRTDLFAELDTLKQRRDASLPGLESALSKATADCVELTSKFESAKVCERIANEKVVKAKASYSSQAARINKELMQSASPEIDKFCESLQEEAQHLRSNAITSPFNQAYTVSVNQRVSAIRDTTDKANKLKLSPVSDLSGAIQQLYDSLPAVNKSH